MNVSSVRVIFPRSACRCPQAVKLLSRSVTYFLVAFLPYCHCPPHCHGSLTPPLSSPSFCGPLSPIIRVYISIRNGSDKQQATSNEERNSPYPKCSRVNYFNNLLHLLLCPPGTAAELRVKQSSLAECRRSEDGVQDTKIISLQSTHLSNIGTSTAPEHFLPVQTRLLTP
jgi:hypothetical protein